MDSNGNGTVDASELKNLIRACIEEEPDDAVMAEVMKQVDKDGSGTMDFAEFCQMLEPFIK